MALVGIEATGAAPRAYLDTTIAEPFEAFTFAPAGAAVCRFGPFGAAAKQPNAWDVKR